MPPAYERRIRDPVRSVRPVRLAGPRCALRELDDADVAPLYALMTEPRVFDRVLDEQPPSPDEVRDAVPAWRAEADAEPRPVYRLAAVEGDRLVGMGTLTVESPQHRRGEIGYVVHADHWGRGLGTEMLVGLGALRDPRHRPVTRRPAGGPDRSRVEIDEQTDRVHPTPTYWDPPPEERQCSPFSRPSCSASRCCSTS
ncbi:GNAT family N-acetyltransferase [Micromonospora soli]|uniref:GNAT family N-acetyltransferase n=1 Tax=Micromonospora sp. NBRC 110009 TaxID=3061627 RepID=UPI0026725E25|nr:GNAT family N-acetyltransferase [Micromonospora sp. NBRC 110009]WKT98888.1 GNAT family N-acetyltransferase [Micromonospora sp. NBRC 110009]